MTKICIDCRYIGPRPSGIGEVTNALVEHIPQLAPDCEFLLLRNVERSQALSQSANVSEISVKSPANGPATLWWLSHVVDLRGVDLFHAPFNILPRGLGMKTLTTVHDIMWLTHPKWCNPTPFGQIERHFYGHGIRRALDESSAIATVSAATRDAIVDWQADVAPRINVTLSGVSDKFRKVPLAPETLTDIGLAPGQRYVLTTGQFAPYKNHEGALRGFAKAFANTPDVALVMVQRRNSGAGTLTSLARELGIETRVHFTGAVPFEALLQLYSGALALLHPSLCEGFGNPLAEAMACGTPVITSRQSAMPEVTGDAALLVDPLAPSSIAAALRQVAENAEIAQDMRTKGLARAKELSWDSFARSNLAIYRDLLAK